MSDDETPDRDAAPASPRWSTRDLVAPVGIFLGALLIAAAFTMGPLVGTGLKKLPLSVDRTWVADGSDGTTVLDRCSIDSPHARVLEAQVQQRRRTVAVRPADSDVVTLQAGTALGVDQYLVDGKSTPAKNVCGEQTLVATIDRVTLGRTDALPTGRSDIQYDDKHAAVAVTDRAGRTYAFPFGFTDPGQYFDVTTRRTVPLVDLGRTQIDGREVARLRAEIPDTDLSAGDPRGVIVRPASWFGEFPGVAPDSPLTAVLHHRATHDLFVDVETGVVVDERTQIDEEYRFSPGVASGHRTLAEWSMTNLRTTLTGDRSSRIDGADEATSRARPVMLATVAAPIAFGVVGGALLVAAIWFWRRAVRRRPATVR